MQSMKQDMWSIHLQPQNRSWQATSAVAVEKRKLTKYRSKDRIYILSFFIGKKQTE